jgi:hypothetical protein
MAAAAVVFAVYYGTDWKQAAGPAAAALGGAALARGVDVVRERQANADRARTQELVSLSETRRLMMALRPIMEHVANTYLAATVVHSLLHNHADLLNDEDRAALTKWRAETSVRQTRRIRRNSHSIVSSRASTIARRNSPRSRNLAEWVRAPVD